MGWLSCFRSGSFGKRGRLNASERGGLNEPFPMSVRKTGVVLKSLKSLNLWGKS